MKNSLEDYLRRAGKIIGERSPGEIAYDDTIVAGLEKGLSIEAALADAAQKHPDEALSCDARNIATLAAHYAYLKEHTLILRKMRGNNT